MVAIIVLLASVAMGAHQGNVASARAAKLVQHYADSEHLVKSMFGNTQAASAVGATVSFSATVNDWISAINSGSSLAPSDGVAFVAGAGNALTGAVDVQSPGSFAAKDAQVVLHRPAYSGLATSSTTISM